MYPVSSARSIQKFGGKNETKKMNCSILKISIKHFKGSAFLNLLQSGPECTPQDLGLLILKECDGVKLLICHQLFLCFFGHSQIPWNF